MLTAYDATMARLVEAGGAEVILVGDSLGMVMQGHEHTLEVELDHMVYHARCVSRGVSWAHVVVDLPFMSYQLGAKQALRSAGRLVQRGGAHAVKLEGGQRVVKSVEAIVQAGIPVMGHLGLTPQSVRAFGGFKVQGRGDAAAREMLKDARALEAAGAYAIVLEGIPACVAAEISAALEIPTIGIGAGSDCDGQVLVVHDMLGLENRFRPRFVQRFAQLGAAISDSVGEYVEAVRNGSFPALEHTYARERPPGDQGQGQGPGGATST